MPQKITKGTVVNLYTCVCARASTVYIEREIPQMSELIYILAKICNYTLDFIFDQELAL